MQVCAQNGTQIRGLPSLLTQYVGLQKLQLCNVRMGKDFFTALSSMPNLHTLDVQGGAIPTVVPTGMSFDNISTLILSKLQISAGWSILLPHLPNLTVFSTSYLHRESVQHLQSVSHLEVGVYLEHDTAKRCCLPSVSSLVLDSRYIEEFFSIEMPRLRRCKLRNVTLRFAAVADMLPNIQALKDLGMVEVELGKVTIKCTV